MTREREFFPKNIQQKLLFLLCAILSALLMSSWTAWAQCEGETPDLCGDFCVNLQTNVYNCGTCGNACTAGDVCISGYCRCPYSFMKCDIGGESKCVDTQQDSENCNGCGLTCSDGQRCIQGSCVQTCGSNEPTNCSGMCVDLQTDVDNCGSCGNACRAEQICTNGICECPIPLGSCGGKCVDFQRDRDHCGQCGRDCKDGQICTSGHCITSCPGGTPTNCFGKCYDTQTDVHHCGACGNTCPEGEVCNGGNCVCPSSLNHCGGKCVDLQRDRDHCGNCGGACPDGKICTSGRCLTSCPSGTPTNCFGACYDTQTDVHHCGACGNACPEGEVCTAGVCECASGLVRASDDRCVDLQEDDQNCGCLGNICNADQHCSAGTCINKCAVLGDADGDAVIGLSDIVYDLRVLSGQSTSSGIPTVTSSATGKVWMDRNLGASQVATSTTDAAAYGDLYQWGRLEDGHEHRTSGISEDLSLVDVPGHCAFILSDDQPYDWRNPQNDSLWQGATGTNNPCPEGFRLPNKDEWDAERLSWSSNNIEGAFNSPLKIVPAGSRSRSDGTISDAGVIGRYWTNTVIGNGSYDLYIYTYDASMYTDVRAEGFSVRCIQE